MALRVATLDKTCFYLLLVFKLLLVFDTVYLIHITAESCHARALNASILLCVNYNRLHCSTFGVEIMYCRNLVRLSLFSLADRVCYNRSQPVFTLGGMVSTSTLGHDYDDDEHDAFFPMSDVNSIYSWIVLRRVLVNIGRGFQLRCQVQFILDSSAVAWILLRSTYYTARTHASF